MKSLEVNPQKKSVELPVNKADIAIIDDDPSFSLLLKEYLQDHGSLQSELFYKGEDFLKGYKAKDKRKIILDYNFGKGLNGLEILKKILLINHKAVVIIVSANDDLESALETIRNGAVDYFLKTNKTVFANIHSSLLKIFEMERNKLN